MYKSTYLIKATDFELWSICPHEEVAPSQFRGV